MTNMENINPQQPNIAPAIKKDIKNIIAPAGMEVQASFIKIGDKFAKTLFIFTYPRYLASGWFNAVINAPNLLDVAIFVHPVDTTLALRKLQKKTAQIEAQLIEGQEKGL